jgi:gentisate 1,2-dioxygenase
MSTEYYNRYQKFNFNGKYTPLPFIKIEPKSSDKTVLYRQTQSRMDKLSQEYYGNPYHGWLIMLANPQYGGVEESIPNNEIIRIPFPFKNSLQQYISEVQKYQKLNGTG